MSRKHIGYLSQSDIGELSNPVVQEAIAEARADERAKTIEACIQAQCKYCKQDYAEPLNLNHIPCRSESGRLIHDALAKTDVWTIEFCNADELHDLKARDANLS